MILKLKLKIVSL